MSQIMPFEWVKWSQQGAKHPTAVSTEILIAHCILFSVGWVSSWFSENQSNNSFIVGKGVVPPHF